MNFTVSLEVQKLQTQIFTYKLILKLLNKWNSERNQETAYTEEIFDDYKGRLEIPNPANRWDCPWIIIRPKEETPFEKINKAVISGKLPKAPISNKTEVSLETNYIYELDKKWGLINDFIIEKQQEHNEGDKISVAEISGSTTLLTLHKIYSPIELKQLKKTFINLSKLHPPKSTDNLTDLYIAFLDSNYENEDEY